jgi:hypothetical protein
VELVKFLEKNQRLHMQSEWLHWRWHHVEPWGKNKMLEKSKCWRKKWKSEILWAKKTFFWHPALEPLGNFSHMATHRGSSKNTRKLKLQSILNKNSPRAHMETEFDIFGVSRKLVKFLVHLSKEKNKLKLFPLLTRCPKSKQHVFYFKDFRNSTLWLLYTCTNKLNMHLQNRLCRR